MRLLDTSIFIYAHGRPHRYKEPCRALISQIGVASQSYAIDTELLQEIAHVYNVRGDRAFGLSLLDLLLDMFPDPISITRDEVAVARQLLERYQALSPRDAIHAAVVLTQGLEGIVTTDRALRQISSIKAYDPLEMASSSC